MIVQERDEFIVEITLRTNRSPILNREFGETAPFMSNPKEPLGASIYVWVARLIRERFPPKLT